MLYSCLYKLDLQEIDEGLPIEAFTKYQEDKLPLDKCLDLNHALLTLLLLRFMIKNFKEKLRVILEICKRPENPCPLFLVLIDICSAMVKFISGKKLNKLINYGEDALEQCFYFYTGFVLRWFELFENNNFTFDSIHKRNDGNFILHHFLFDFK